MSGRILLIEDDDRLSQMVAQYLSEHGFEVEVRGDATGGLEAARRIPFDALVLDVMLPDLDGFEVCRRVRAESDVPVLMLTARGDETDRIVGLELGADDYLPKPFNPRELVARLRAILRRREPRADRGAPPLRFGRLEIDRDARVARLDGRPCQLTSYQFELLCVLATSAGRALSRDVLMDRLRGEAFSAFDRSIDVHVSRIRAAIEDDPKRPRRILTVRGVGYLFARSQDGDADS
ncbi:MAG: response regulator transcription factor [Deltaproteobacteria bacterium]|jgi:DNA-binding response OmpR family regulator|nr:response regulator transcription factor [Deltaproteobacteria bacterium]MBW2414280.1 response regulator transcription factor [Deltaproteobacteria bacterium]